MRASISTRGIHAPPPFDVQLNGCRRAMFRLNDEVDHVCRVTVTPDGLAAQKDDHDHDGPDREVPFGKVSLPIRSAEWKTVLLELCGVSSAAIFGLPGKIAL